MKTGRDVIVGMLLGAEEFGFSTTPLVVNGCVMMRVCHLDTCPVGVATQNPELRKRYTGKPEFVENFFWFIAEEVREYMAALGFRTVDEAVGHTELIDAGQAVDNWKAEGIDLAPLFTVPDVPEARLHRPALHLDAGPRAGQGARPDVHPARGGRARRRHAGAHRDAGPQRQPHGRDPARRRGDAPVRAGRPGGRHHPRRADRVGRAVVGGLPPDGDHPSTRSATPTTTSRRASPAGGSSCGCPRTRGSRGIDELGHDEAHIIAGNFIAYGATGGEVSCADRWGSGSACATSARRRRRGHRRPCAVSR